MEWIPVSAYSVLPAEVLGYCVTAVAMHSLADNKTKYVSGINSTNTTLEGLGIFVNYSVVVAGRSLELCGAPSKPLLLQTKAEGM